MSRFLSVLYDFTPALSMENFVTLSHEINSKLESKNSFIQANFPFFYKKLAPVSKTAGLVDVEVTIEIEHIDGIINKKLS